MIEKKNIVKIGKFLKTHALKGELNALLDIDPAFVEEGHAFIVEMDGIYVPFYCYSIREKGSTTFLIKLDGIDSEVEAKIFVNKDIYAMRSELAPFYEMEEDEIKDQDGLLGYVLLDGNDRRIGIIDHLDARTQNVLFWVKTDGGSIIYVPVAEEWITNIDDEQKILKMHLPDGLLDLNS